MVRILLADNQAIFRAGIARVLELQEDIRVLGQTGDAAAVLELTASVRGCVLLVTQSLGADMDRLLAATAAMSNRVVLMVESDVPPSAAVARRLDGLLTRQATAADLLTCLRKVSNGERCMSNPESAGAADAVGKRMRDLLSARELQIVGFIVQGLKNRQIADELGTKEQVVKNYLRTIYDKTGSSDRLELALFTLHHRTLAEAAAEAANDVQRTGAAV